MENSKVILYKRKKNDLVIFELRIPHFSKYDNNQQIGERTLCIFFADKEEFYSITKNTLETFYITSSGTRTRSGFYVFDEYKEICEQVEKILERKN